MTKSRIALGVVCLGLTLAASAQAKPLSSREFNKLKKDAQRAIATRQYGSLREALRGLAADDSKKALELMTQLVVAVPQVFDAAVEAASGMSSDEVQDSVLSKIERSGTKPSQKIFLTEVAARMGGQIAVDGLKAALGAFKRQPQVARAAVQLIAAGKVVKAVDGLIDLLEELEGSKDEESLLTSQVRDALTGITGESFATASLYRSFWAPRKASFRPVTGSKPKGWEGTSERKRPTFFGSEIKSNRVVFVIDVSGSMHAADPPPRKRTGRDGSARGPKTGGGAGAEDAPKSDSRVRIDRAKFQLAQAIKALPPRAKFTILAYSGAMVPPGSAQGGGDPDAPLPRKIGGFEWLQAWAGKLTSASDRSKSAAGAWIDELKANGSTFTYNALRAAFEVDGVDTIVLLSDGAPTEIDRSTGQLMTPAQILEKIEALNRFKRLRIDTFGFDTASSGRAAIPGFGPGGADLSKFMRDIAKQNGGAYTQIR